MRVLPPSARLPVSSTASNTGATPPASRNGSAARPPPPGHRAQSTFENLRSPLSPEMTLIAEARVQPGVMAWAAEENAKKELCLDDDGAYLGALGQPVPASADIDSIAGILPRDGSKPIDRVVFVNGVASTRGVVASQMQQMADMTGGEVVGLYNATDGVLKDVVQTLGDRLDIGENEAVSSLRRLILSKVQAGEPLRLASYSQGALITSRALDDAKEALIEGGLTRAEAEDRLSLVKVETFGGAASHYPDGPQYLHHLNRYDPVSLFSLYALGGNNTPLVDPGKGAKLHFFNDFSWKPSTHSMAKYLENHRRFEEYFPAPAKADSAA